MKAKYEIIIPNEIVVPRDAATLMLLRQSVSTNTGFEVLMVRRHAESRFVPDAYVFPGGRMDEADYDPEVENLCDGFNFDMAKLLIPDMMPQEKAIGAWIAAIRETFEEVGILLAFDNNGNFISIDKKSKQKFDIYREELHSGKLSIVDIMNRETLRIAARKLYYFANWITPVASPIRYNVRFFVAKTPEDQHAKHDGKELVETRWIAPQSALEEHERGDFPIILPTKYMLAELAKFQDIEDAIQSTHGKEIPAILSVHVLRNGEPVEVMPDEVEDLG